mmetsp:Transcript_31693/g.82806  ORF Transcript_31693/g.82806 Transcript_31693/m.82806 type:complete len:290 (+) Transcript_31693:328-1197(+)
MSRQCPCPHHGQALLLLSARLRPRSRPDLMDRPPRSAAWSPAPREMPRMRCSIFSPIGMAASSAASPLYISGFSWGGSSSSDRSSSSSPPPLPSFSAFLRFASFSAASARFMSASSFSSSSSLSSSRFRSASAFPLVGRPRSNRAALIVLIDVFATSSDVIFSGSLASSASSSGSISPAFSATIGGGSAAFASNIALRIVKSIDIVALKRSRSAGTPLSRFAMRTTFLMVADMSKAPNESSTPLRSPSWAASVSFWNVSLASFILFLMSFWICMMIRPLTHLMMNFPSS